MAKICHFHKSILSIKRRVGNLILFFNVSKLSHVQNAKKINQNLFYSQRYLTLKLVKLGSSPFIFIISQHPRQETNI